MNEKVIKQNILISITLFVIILIPFIILPFYGDNTKELRGGNRYEVSAYFVDENGDAADIGQLPKGEADFYLRHSTPEGMALCFQSKSVDFIIYSGEEVIYRYNPVVPRMYGRGYGKMFHYVLIPEAEDGYNSNIRIHTHSANKDGKSYIKDVYFADPADYMAGQLSANMPNFLICFFIFVLGLLLTIGGMAIKSEKGSAYAESDHKHRLEILSMGVFALAAASWSGTETEIMQIITGNPSGVHLISYFSLMVLPVPTVMFIAAMTDNLKRLPVKFITYGTPINFVIVLMSVSLGGPDYHDMLTTTHLLLGIAIITDFVLIIESIVRRTISKKTIAVITASFLIVLISGILEIARYRYISNSTDTSSIFRIGMSAFVIILSVYEVMELMRYTRYKEEAYTLDRLAHTDSLTQLLNRTAYNERIQKLEEETAGSGIIVYLDINDLKSVNDYYGHDAGDKHIKAAARHIKETFTAGESYRIGGDEFAVVIENTEIGKADDMIQKLSERCKRYNAEDEHPVPLKIAAGYSIYNCQKKNIRDAVRRADDAMYENKIRIKSNTQ